MAKTTGHRTNPWVAFLAGAVAMLAIGLAWLGWTRAHQAATSVRTGFQLPHTPSLPSVPTTPPPEGPKLPQIPARPR